jgi:hypothetical protein
VEIGTGNWFFRTFGDFYLAVHCFAVANSFREQSYASNVVVG